jgi:hypothetical protein
MSQTAQSAAVFEDFLTPAFIRPPQGGARETVAQARPNASGRKYWAAVALLIVYWSGWGGMLALWLLSAPSDTTQGLLLAVLAAVGMLVTVAVLTAASVMDEIHRGRTRPLASSSTEAPTVSVRLPSPRPIATPPPLPAREAANPPPPPSLPPHVIAEGELAGRYYRHFSDGSVEIATLLGLRRFESLMDAREFIGPGEASVVH